MRIAAFVRGLAFAGRRLLHRVCSRGVALDRGVRIFEGVRLRATDGAGIEIGRECVLSRGLEMQAQRGNIRVGARCFIGPWTTITAKAGVSIGRDCLIAERVTIRDQDHAIAEARPGVAIADAGYVTAPVHIGDGAWIAAGAVVLKGVRIGTGAVVAANAVVVGDVGDYEIVGGIPAKRIGMRTLADG